MSYSINELANKRFKHLKSRITILKYINSGLLNATNLKSKGSKYNKWVISEQDVKKFLKNN